MKSGKSYELISHFAPLQYTEIPFGLFQSARNVRDTQVQSRNGTGLDAIKIASVGDIPDFTYQIIGIDEFHMFAPEDILHVDKLIKQGTKVVISSLDTDYQGKLFETVSGLLELGPKEVKFKRAVCEKCKNPEAVYSQIFKEKSPLLEGMPPVIPDDGTFMYMPVCRHCFTRKQTAIFSEITARSSQ